MNLPNKITTFRMVMVIVILGLLLFPFQQVGIDIPMLFNGKLSLIYLISFILFVIASCSDFVDGYIARKYNLITNFGKFMDPIADKMLVNSILIVLAVNPNNLLQHNIPVVLVVIMIARDLVVDGLRLVAANRKIVLAANIFGKIKTVLQMVGLAIWLLNDLPFSLIYKNSITPWVSLVIMLAATLVSLLSGIIYVYQNRKVLTEEEVK